MCLVNSLEDAVVAVRTEGYRNHVKYKEHFDFPNSVSQEHSDLFKVSETVSANLIPPIRVSQSPASEESKSSGRRFQAKTWNRKLPRQRSQANAPKSKLPIESSKSNVAKR